MSFKVLVIPEDPTLNGYILKPLTEAILAEAGKPKAKVTVLSKPAVGGYDQALRAIKETLPDSYSHWDLWIFLPDADRASPEAMTKLEAVLHAKGITLLCCPAQPEVEIYCCVGYRDDLGASWSAVRSSQRMKEDHFEPLLKTHGDAKRAGAGRDILIDKALSKMGTLFQLCPELATLRDRIKETFSN
jgi:hypothetical protein